MDLAEIDKLSFKASKIALASGLTGEDHLYALRRYLKMVRKREEAAIRRYQKRL